MNFPKLLSLVVPAALVLTPALHAAQPKQKRVKVQNLGTSSLVEAQARTALAIFQPKPRATLQQRPQPHLQSRSAMATGINLSTGLVFGGFPVVAPDPSFIGFDALDQTDSGQATGFVVEPPDQGMGTNGNYVVEAINDAVRIFSSTGKALTPPISIYAFFRVSTAPNPDGSSNTLSDPRVFFDWESGRWFVTDLEYKLTPQGALTGGSSVLIAVSSASMTTYTVFSIDVSDASYGACPCLGDQPLLGLNQDGVYLNNNEFSTSTGGFQTTLITAINKRDLLDASSTVTAVGFDGLTEAEGQAFSVQPAFPAPGARTDTNRGTEFFTSSLNFNGTVDNRVAVWALTNTTSLTDNVPNLNLQQTIIPTEVYGEPVPVMQKAGSYPLGMSLGQPEETLDPGDNRMQQLYYSQGKLYCALNTLLLDPTGQGPQRTGAAWFAIQPDATFATLSAKIANQGFIGIKNGSVLYPSFAVNSAGMGIIEFSLAGQDYYPSTGYVDYTSGKVTPMVHLAGIGQAPEDGFSGYAQFGGAGVARWGDYGAAMVAPNGTLFGAGEYIPNPTIRPRTTYTNHGTYMFQVR